MGTKPHQSIVAEASAWFIEFRAGDVQGTSRTQFVEWLRRSPENIQAYLEVSGVWASLPTSDPEGRFDIAALIAQARAAGDVIPLNGSSSSSSSSSEEFASRQRLPASPRHWRPTALSVAATAILAIISWGYYELHYLRAVFSTDIGEERSVVLADGSSIELNAQSRIRVDLTDKVRNVTLLQGQALFHVAKDSRRPFIVRAGFAQVRAVGTEFDVYRKSTETVVTVVEGRVETTNESAAAGGEAVVLSAGQQLTVQPHSNMTPATTDTTAATAWLQHHLTFEETPLSEVVEEFNRYNRRPLKLEDAELARIRISGVYSSTDPASLLGFLRSQPSIEVVDVGNEVRIRHHEAH